MPEAQDELLRAIDSLVQSKTFSLDGIEAIKLLRDKAEAQARKLENAARQIETLEKAYKTQSQTIVGYDSRIKEFQQREAEIENHERKKHELEQQVAVAHASRMAFEDAMRMVFRNTIVREGVTDTVPIRRTSAGGGDYVEDRARSHTTVRSEEPDDGTFR